jgi:hypothetical protein
MANTRAQKTAQNLSTLTTAGDLAYASAAGTPARLGIGSSAQVLTVAAGVPSWATPASGGKVLQVVEGTAATAATSSSSTYADTGLTATITPSLATSKILVFAAVSGCGKNSSDSSLGLRLLRNAVTISTYTQIGNTGSAALNFVGTAALNKLDAPSLTSAITYKVQFRNNDNLATAYVMAGNSDASIILMEIGA